MYLSHIILFCSSLFFLFSLSCKLPCVFTSESSWRTAIPTCCMFSWVYCWSRKSHFWCTCSVPWLTMIGSRLIWNHFSWSISWFFLVTWSNKLKDVAVSYSKSFLPDYNWKWQGRSQEVSRHIKCSNLLHLHTVFTFVFGYHVQLKGHFCCI